MSYRKRRTPKTKIKSKREIHCADHVSNNRCPTDGAKVYFNLATCLYNAKHEQSSLDTYISLGMFTWFIYEVIVAETIMLT